MSVSGCMENYTQMIEIKKNGGSRFTILCNSLQERASEMHPVGVGGFNYIPGWTKGFYEFPSGCRRESQK